MKVYHKRNSQTNLVTEKSLCSRLKETNSVKIREMFAVIVFSEHFVVLFPDILYFMCDFMAAVPFHIDPPVVLKFM